MKNLPTTATPDLDTLRTRYKSAISAGRLPAALIPATKAVFGLYPKHADRWVALLEESKFDPDEAAQCARPYAPPPVIVSPTDAIKADAPTPTRLNKYMGEATTKIILSSIIMDAAKLLNVGKHIESVQLLYLVDWVLKQYGYLRLSEIKYILDGGVTGKYGQIYDRLDVAVIGAWFYAYDQERTAIMERLQAEDAHNKAQAATGALFHPTISKSLISAAERAEAKNKQLEADRKAEKEREREERKRLLLEQQAILFPTKK